MKPLEDRPWALAVIGAAGTTLLVPSALSLLAPPEVLDALILLGDALEAEEIPIAAVVLARIVAAYKRTRLIDRAAARLGIEEPADPAEILVRLAPHYPFVTIG